MTNKKQTLSLRSICNNNWPIRRKVFMVTFLYVYAFQRRNQSNWTALMVRLVLSLTGPKLLSHWFNVSILLLTLLIYIVCTDNLFPTLDSQSSMLCNNTLLRKLSLWSLQLDNYFILACQILTLLWNMAAITTAAIWTKRITTITTQYWKRKNRQTIYNISNLASWKAWM